MSQRGFRRAHARRVAKERRRAATLKRRGGVLVSVLGATTVFAASAQAATYTVTTTSDGPAAACTATCTLRDALAAANLDTTADTINFASGLTGPITLSDGALPISGTGGLTITGPGSGALTVSGSATSQIFDISAPSTASVSITGLTLTDGSAGSGSPGGAIDVSDEAPLTLTGDTISGSTTDDTSGGGGVYTAGPLTLSNSVISGNIASAGRGGGIEEDNGSAAVTVTNSTVTGNTGTNGGGIDGGNESISAGSQITNNHANGTDSTGGGLDPSESLGLQGSIVSGNTSTGEGGGVFLDTKYGSTISGSTISGNTSGAGGGAYIEDDPFEGGADLVQNSTISANHATDGAGVDVDEVSGAGLTITASTISGNQGVGTSFGGGLLLSGYVYDSFELEDSTISGNTATSGGGVSLGAANSDKPLLGKNGNGNPGSIDLDNSTIAANTATSQGGGIYLSEYTAGTPTTEQSGTANITSTIVSGNTAAGAAQDLARAATSTSGGFYGAFSLIEQPGSAPFAQQSVIVGASPQLGALTNNGGPTQTMLPAGTSPVIDQGHAPVSLTEDQRGDPRTVVTGLPKPAGGDGTDIGSVELPASSVVIPATPAPTAGFSVQIRGTLLGGSATPLLIDDSTPVTCSVKSGTLASCVIEVRAGGKLLASGEATATSPTTQLSAEVTATPAGRSVLAHSPLGITGTATSVGSAIGSPSLSGNVHLLAGTSISVPLGKRSAKLSKGAIKELDQIAKLITGATSVTCTAYSDKGKNTKSVTRSEAKAACARLVQDGLKGKIRTVGKGYTNPVASDKTKKGRAANNRVVVSFSF